MSTMIRVLAGLRVPVTPAALLLAILVGALTLFRAEALPPVIDLDTTPADLTVYGDDAVDHSGSSLAAGDIDGDGVDDIIIGANGADGSGSGTCPPAGVGDRCEAGETYVMYGGDSLPAAIDLDSTSADLTVFGDDAHDGSGNSVAAGDINGDGTDDLIIGAPSASPAGGSNSGETYVIYGGPSLPSTIDLDSAAADLTVFGDDAGDRSGLSVAAGDIDGDTTDDLIIGAGWADGSGTGTDCFGGVVGDRCEAGETYVIYGGPGLPATIDLDSASADLTVYGDDAGDLSGLSVAAGDIDGDTTDDLIIGAPLADGSGSSPNDCDLDTVAEQDGDRCEAGDTYVIYGGDSLPATIDLDQCPIQSSQCPGLTVYGDDADDRSGDSVAAGDINGDSTDDLIIGAWSADGSGTGTSCVSGVGDRCEAGETYIIYGGDSLPTTIDLDSTSADLTVFGDDSNDYSGSSVAAGDFEGDGTDDLIIGAYAADPAGRTNAGETYVIYGGDSLPATIDLDSASADLTAFGDDGGDSFGYSVAAGDSDADSTEDLIIGAYEGDGSGTGTECFPFARDQCEAGETYVIYGEAPATPTATATPTPGPGGCPGDVDGDGRVNFRDVRLVARALPSRPGDWRWNPVADVNQDNRVDLRDLFVVVSSLRNRDCG